MSGEGTPPIHSGIGAFVVYTSNAEASRMLAESQNRAKEARSKFRERALAQRSGEEMGVEEATYAEALRRVEIARAIAGGGDHEGWWIQGFVKGAEWARAAVLAEVDEAANEMWPTDEVVEFLDVIARIRNGGKGANA